MLRARAVPISRRMKSLCIIELPPAARVLDFGLKPPAAEDRKKRIAGNDGALDDLDEVGARFDVGDVHEHTETFAKPRPQVVEQPAGMAGTVLTPVADNEM